MTLIDIVMDAVMVFLRGDGDRDLDLWAARRSGGSTLGELGWKAGNMDYSAVSMAIRGFEPRAKRKAQLMEALSR